MNPLNDEFYDDEDENDNPCPHCHGEGWGIIGVDWECDDPINGPYDGDIEKCPFCNGSGREEDVWIW